MTFARVPASTSASSGVFDPLGGIGQRRHMEPVGEVPTAPLLERCGLTVVDTQHGVVELANSPYVHNSRGRINGGVLGMVFQGAAEAAVPGYAASDLHIHYLTGARTGPVRTSTRHRARRRRSRRVPGRSGRRRRRRPHDRGGYCHLQRV